MPARWRPCCAYLVALLSCGHSAFCRSAVCCGSATEKLVPRRGGLPRCEPAEEKGTRGGGGVARGDVSAAVRPCRSGGRRESRGAGSGVRRGPGPWSSPTSEAPCTPQPGTGRRGPRSAVPRTARAASSSRRCAVSPALSARPPRPASRATRWFASAGRQPTWMAWKRGRRVVPGAPRSVHAAGIRSSRAH